MYTKDSSCALAAACDAMGIAREEMAYTTLAEHFPILLTSRSGKPQDVMDEIWRRNDSRMHTREAIADWVETLEKEQSCDTFLTNVPSASLSTVGTS